MIQSAVLVTGANGALGLATREILAKGGWQVAPLVGPRALGGSDVFGPLDLTDEEATRNTVAAIADRLGRLDGVVHLAGAFDMGPILNGAPEQWARLQAANVGSLVSIVRAAVPHMAAGGAIVAVGGMAAARGTANMAAYATAKSGVLRVVEALAAELAPQGIRANAVLPGVIDTPANRRDMPDEDGSTWTHPAAIAEVIAFLLSPQARAINGAGIPVNNPAGALR